MKTFDLYGLSATDLGAACRVLAAALHLAFVPHESSYHGGEYYRCGGPGTEHFILKRNYDESEGEFAEQEFRDSLILLYVNETERPTEVQQLLAPLHDVTLLRRELL